MHYLPADPQEWLRDGLLLLVLAIASYTDTKHQKIYNKLTFPAMLVGLVLNAWIARPTPLTGLKLAGQGLGVGFLCLLIPFALGGTKAGDVKLLMAVGTLKGPVFTFFGFLYGAVIFGVLGVVLLRYRGQLRTVADNIYQFFYALVVLQTRTPLTPRPEAEESKFPYGVALSLGYVTALLLEYALGRVFFVTL